MKTEYLKELGLNAEQIGKVMAENGRDIEKYKATAEKNAREAEQAGEKLAAYADADVDGLKSAAADWEKRYREDTAALKKQLGEAEYARSAEAAALGEKFSSEAARRAFLSDLKAAALPLAEGKLVGYGDFKEAWAEKDPAAFAGERQTPPPYAAATGSHPVLGAEKEISRMGYFERLELKKRDPGLYKQLKGE